jgi:hypothetical protein
MVQIYSPRSEIELLILKSVFADAGIRYFVRNDTFGSLYMGPHVEAYNRKTLCVAEADADESLVLLEEFLERTGRRPPAAAHPPAAAGFVEGLLHRLVRWFSPEPPPCRRPLLRLIKNPHPEDPAPRPAAGRRDRPPLRLV